MHQLRAISFLAFSLLSYLSAADMACGPGTIWDTNANQCRCDAAACNGGIDDTSKVYIAGLFDTNNFDWGVDIFNAVVEFINDKNDGWFDDLFLDGAQLVGRVSDAGCDPDIAVGEYWELQNNWGRPLSGVVGCRCSGASMAVARVAGLQDVPQVSMASTSSKLSDSEKFPTFFRTVGADRGDARGFVALLRSFDWDSVMVINTDKQYTKDLATDFSAAWVGEHYDDDDDVAQGRPWTGTVTYSHTIKLNPDDTLDDESASQALRGIPKDGSRVIILLAHSQHSFEIMKRAGESGVQSDTIWIGSQGWANRIPDDTSWMPNTPGYLGIVPRMDKDTTAYNEFLTRMKDWQARNGRRVMEHLPDYAAAMLVDSTLSLAMALSNLPPERRSNGNEVVEALRGINLGGVSGKVRFTSEGDRRDPVYDIVNLPNNHDGEWQVVGSIKLHSDRSDVSVSLAKEELCWAGRGCGGETPSDEYPQPKQKLPAWVLVVIPLIALLTVALGLKYWRSKVKKSKLRESICDLQSRLDAVKNIDNELAGLGITIENAKDKQDRLIKERFALQGMPTHWTSPLEGLIEVPPDDEQYWNVMDQLRETMSDAWASKVWRVQNKSLWTFYSFHKDRLKMHGADPNERHVWHGTSTLDPAIIYSDRQDGFMMQFSNKGFWGRGIYFADKASYSNSYTYKPSGSSERPGASDDEKEMFFARLLVGNEVLMNRDESNAKAAECRNLTVPPDDPTKGQRYNTVTGYTAGSQVWIVYENGRAYPDYLVRYYRGKRDAKRSPFKSRREAISHQRMNSSRTETSAPSISASRTVPEWVYFDKGWQPYNDADQKLLEGAFQSFKSGSSTQSKVQVKSNEWTYEVDFVNFTQTNLEHSSHTQRKVQRQIVVRP